MSAQFFCLNCGMSMVQKQCKVRCLRCGYFEDCSDGAMDHPNIQDFALPVIASAAKQSPI